MLPPSFSATTTAPSTTSLSLTSGCAAKAGAASTNAATDANLTIAFMKVSLKSSNRVKQRACGGLPRQAPVSCGADQIRKQQSRMACGGEVAWSSDGSRIAARRACVSREGNRVTRPGTKDTARSLEPTVGTGCAQCEAHAAASSPAP